MISLFFSLVSPIFWSSFLTSFDLSGAPFLAPTLLCPAPPRPAPPRCCTPPHPWTVSPPWSCLALLGGWTGGWLDQLNCSQMRGDLQAVAKTPVLQRLTFEPGAPTGADAIPGTSKVQFVAGTSNCDFANTVAAAASTDALPVSGGTWPTVAFNTDSIAAASINKRFKVRKGQNGSVFL